MRNLPRYCTYIGSAAAVWTAVGLFVQPQEYFRSYLFAYLLVLGVSLGSLANLMLHEVTGGEWGVPLRQPWLVAARLMPYLAIAFIPLLFGFQHVYAWVDTNDPEMKSKAWWLNGPFFMARAVFYLGIWTLMAWRWSSLAVRSPRMRPPSLRRFSAIGLIVYGLTVSVAAVDWIMSLLPKWYSTTFGLYIGTSQMLGAMALGIVGCAWLFPHDSKTEHDFHDFGNLLLMYVMSWAYLAFTQYLIIWAEDLPNEIAWYLPRMQTSWRWFALLVFVLQFAVPFVLLLFRVLKRSPQRLGQLALLVLFAQWLFWFYLVTPELKPKGFALAWSDLAASLAFIGLWLGAWLRDLHKPTRGAPIASTASEAV